MKAAIDLRKQEGKKENAVQPWTKIWVYYET